MDYQDKTKYELINELEALRRDYDALVAINNKQSEIILPEGKALFQSLVENLQEKNEELILATEKAKESEIQQKELLNNALFPVIIASFNGRLIYLNRAAFDFFGVEYDRNLDEIDAIGFWVHPENRAFFVNQLITKGENINFESEFFTTDKRRKTALLSSSTINYRGGKVILSIYNDITERKLAEEAMRLSEDRFRGIFNNLQDAFFQADTEANFTLASPSVLPMYGYDSVDELIGKPVQILYADLKEREILVEKLKVQSSVTDYICQAKEKMERHSGYP